MADELVVGVPQRSPGRPEPVLRHAESSILPGGYERRRQRAPLGAQVEVCGVVGDDQTGRQLIQALQVRGWL